MSIEKKHSWFCPESCEQIAIYSALKMQNKYKLDFV